MSTPAETEVFYEDQVKTLSREKLEEHACKWMGILSRIQINISWCDDIGELTPRQALNDISHMLAKAGFEGSMTHEERAKRSAILNFHLGDGEGRKA